MDYATSDVTATAPADYTAASGTLTFAPGVTTQTIPITVQGDLSDEANETYRVTLSNPANVTIATAIGTGTITDNDPPPSIVINDVSLAEGNAGTTNIELRRVAVGPERPDRDRQLRDRQLNRRPARRLHDDLGTLTFTPGQGTKTISVPVVGDMTDEVDETFFVNLSGADQRLDRRPAGRRGPSWTTIPRRRSRSTTSRSRRATRDGQHDVHRHLVGGERQDGDGRLRHGGRHRDRSGRLRAVGRARSRSTRAWSPGRSPFPSSATPSTSSTRRSSRTSRTRRTPRSPTTKASGRSWTTTQPRRSASTTCRPRRVTRARRPRRSPCRSRPSPASRSRWTTRPPTAPRRRPATTRVCRARCRSRPARRRRPWTSPCRETC